MGGAKIRSATSYISGRWRHSLQEVMIISRSADVGSGHNLLLAEVKLSLLEPAAAVDTAAVRHSKIERSDKDSWPCS